MRLKRLSIFFFPFDFAKKKHERERQKCLMDIEVCEHTKRSFNWTII